MLTWLTAYPLVNRSSSDGLTISTSKSFIDSPDISRSHVNQPSLAHEIKDFCAFVSQWAWTDAPTDFMPRQSKDSRSGICADNVRQRLR